jgi:hypothetical protein
MSGGENPIRIGNDGEKMLREFLKLIGWNNLSTNESFLCTNGSKHKITGSKSDKTNHNVDASFYFDNPLNHAETDVVLCSSKHNQDAYSDKSKAYGHLKELAHSIECASDDYSYLSQFESKTRTKVVKGLLFWVSSNTEEKQKCMISEISTALINEVENNQSTSTKLRGIKYDSIYLVDNQKATFISSAIKSTQSIYPNSKVNFLYPHTGLNNRSEDILAYGEVMPVQYINGSIVPIVVEDNNQIILSVFCDSNFDKEYLKRIIWLVHKISGLVSAVNIYFNDYDKTRDFSDENRIKQSFQNSTLIDRILLKRTLLFDFVTLKEEQGNVVLQNKSAQKQSEKQVDLAGIDNDLDRILPFGEMIKPVIASTALSETDIKAFLIRKGIYIGDKDKQGSVPLISTLLLAPNELNDLKFLLKSKEDRIKSVPRSCDLHNQNATNESLGKLITPLLSQYTIGKGISKQSTLIEQPTLRITKDEVYVGFKIEKQNTTKDLLTGKQHNECGISIKINNGKIISRIDYTSRETYGLSVDFFKKIETKLVEEEIVKDDFFSLKFNTFDNNGRINFFLRFLNIKEEFTFTNGKLEHITIKPDSSIDEDVPFDIESLKNKVNELSISGSELDSVHFFKDEYKKVLLMQRVKLKYDYSYGAESGKCVVDLDFKNAFSNSDVEAELQFYLEIQKGKNTRGRDLEKLHKDLTKKFNDVIQKIGTSF